MAVAYSALVSESLAERPDVRSAGETSGGRSAAYADPRSVPEDVRDRLLHRGGGPNKGPTKRAGCAECKVVFSTVGAFNAHVRADGHIDPVEAGLAWNPCGYFTFGAGVVADTNIVNAKTNVMNEQSSTRAQHPSGGSGRNRGTAVPRTRMRSIVPPMGPVAGDSAAEHHRLPTADLPSSARR